MIFMHDLDPIILQIIISKFAEAIIKTIMFFNWGEDLLILLEEKKVMVISIIYCVLFLKIHRKQGTTKTEH